MGLIPEDKIAEIRDRTDIVAVIGQHVPLRRAGGNFLGLCPFHAEKTPSFNVNPQKGFFYCFGCQKSGDVFRFLMDLEGRSFAEVARELARRAGVEIPEVRPGEGGRGRASGGPGQEDQRQKLLRLMDLACAWFESQLPRHPRALAYLEERGVSEDTRRLFRLGYAPEGWDHLLRHLEARGVPHELAELAGLLVRREEAQRLPARAPATRGSHYDRFRDRIIFPLINPDGAVLAFGGRVLPAPEGKQGDGAKEGAKYINSPETPIYKKGDHLYGLHAARDAVRKGRQAVLVEGNFDVIALHQYGVSQAVAPMGTALTETQVRLLKRLLAPDGHVVLMLDGDRAGRSATLKDIWLFSQANMDDLALFAGHEVDIRVAQLPDGEDPDTYVAKDRAGFERKLKSAKPGVDYVLDEAIKLAEHDSVAGKAKVLMQVAPLLQAIGNPTTVALYVERLAESLAISPALVWRHVREEQGRRQGAGRSSASASATTSTSTQARARAQGAAAPTLDATERSLLSLLGDHPGLLAQLGDDVIDLLTDVALAELLREARELARGGDLSVYQMIDLAPMELRDAVAAAVLKGEFARHENPAQALQSIAGTLRAHAVQRERDELRQAMKRVLEAGDRTRYEEMNERVKRLNELLQQSGRIEGDAVR